MTSAPGNVSEKDTSVRSNALAFVKVTVIVEATVSTTLAGEKAWDTVGEIGVVESAVGQAVVPADAGAVLEALVALTVMVAVSVAPAESVTVSVTLPLPGSIDTCAVLAPEAMETPPVAVQAYETIDRPHAAALPLASKTAAVPALIVVGSDTAAIGCCAACTALKALAMPVPHCPDAGQEHSSVVESKSGHTGRLPAFDGKGDALDSNRATSCAGVKL